MDDILWWLGAGISALGILAAVIAYWWPAIKARYERIKRLREENWDDW